MKHLSWMILFALASCATKKPNQCSVLNEFENEDLETLIMDGNRKQRKEIKRFIIEFADVKEEQC